MTLRTRRIFFWSLIPCFVVGGAAAVLYSQGYRIDTETRQVAKVGALFVRGFPKTAHITLDGETLNTGSWWPLQSGTLVGSLVPGTYSLHAEAPGFRTWDAEVVIRPALVTERKSLILFPDRQVPLVMATGTAAADIDAPDDFERPVVITGADNPRAVVGTAAVPGTYVGTVNGKLALTSAVRRGKVTGQILTLQAPTEPAATTVTLQGEGETAVMADSVLHRESSRLIAAYDGSTGRRTVFASSTDPIGAYIRTSSVDAWQTLGARPQLQIRRRGATSVIAIPLGEIASIQRSGAALGIAGKNGSLWLVNPDSGAIQEIGHRAAHASWKDDGSAVAAIIDDQIEVIPLKRDVPHGRLSGILDRADKVRRIAWYPDGEHLFVETSEALLFADVIDGSTAEQHAYRLPLPDAWSYSDRNKALYVIRGGAALSYVFPD